MGSMLSAEDYKRAFLEVRPEMTDKHLEMLRAHYDAPDHSITMSELARKVGYTSHSSRNAHYPPPLSRNHQHLLGTLTN